MEPVPFATRQVSHRFLLVCAAKVESGAVGPRIYGTVSDLERFFAVGDGLVDGRLVVEIGARLVDVGDLDG